MEDKVIYIGCPHCGKGWYGELLDVGLEPYENAPNIYKLSHFIITGINPTDIMEPIKCLNCGKTYTPINKGMVAPELGWELIEGDDNTHVMVMLRWVAERVMNTKGT